MSAPTRLRPSVDPPVRLHVGRGQDHDPLGHPDGVRADGADDQREAGPEGGVVIERSTRRRVPQPEASSSTIDDTPPPDPHSPTGSTNPPILPRRPLDGGGANRQSPRSPGGSPPPPSRSAPGPPGPPDSIVAVAGGVEGRTTGPGRRIRVLVVVKCLGYGGAERLLVDLMASRDAGSFDYEVAYVLAAENALVPAVRAEGVPVHDLGATHNWDLRWMPRFATLLRRGHFDVVHFHLPYRGDRHARRGHAARGSVASGRLHRAQPLGEDGGAGQGPQPTGRQSGPGAGRRLPRRPRRTARGPPAPGRGRRARGAPLGARTDARSAPGGRGRGAGRLGVGCDQLLVLTVANLRVEKGYDVPARRGPPGRQRRADPLRRRRAGTP